MSETGDRQEARVLLIETSHRLGLVALAQGNRLLGERRLDEARRHARDLAPAIRDLLAEQGWRARDLDAVAVSRGPGSYTGLRVGVMSAKTLAYATGCKLLAIDTFAALAQQAPPEALRVDVIADAQKDKVYVQSFVRTAAGEPLVASAALCIKTLAAWCATLSGVVSVTGPGLEKYDALLPAEVPRVPRADWHVHAPSLVTLAFDRLHRGECDDPFAAEPLYLRPSSAEEQLA